MLDALLRPVQRLSQARFLDRLEQIVHGVDLERANGVLVVRRHEGDERHPQLIQRADDADAVQFGHLPVEQGQVRLFRFDDGHRLLPGCRLADHDDVVERSKERDQKRPGRTLVVGDDDLELRARITTGRVSRLGDGLRVAGRRISTVVPSPAAE